MCVVTNVNWNKMGRFVSVLHHHRSLCALSLRVLPEFDGHGNVAQNISWKGNGSLLVSVCKVR